MVYLWWRALTEGDNDEGDSSDVLHLPVELEVALPPDNLVTPLYHSAKEGIRYLLGTAHYSLAMIPCCLWKEK